MDQVAGKRTIRADGQPDHAIAEASAVNDTAVAAYELSVQAGNPLSERKLAQMFGRTSRRWARARIADARQASPVQDSPGNPVTAVSDLFSAQRTMINGSSLCTAMAVTERDWHQGQRWYHLEAMVDRETFDRIKEKHGPYASWAVWSEPDGRPKSNQGDLTVLDPDRNPALLGILRSDVVMVGLNLSRDLPVPFGNFHDAKAEGQDYKIRFAFTGTPFYGAYMTDIIKGVMMLKSGNLMRYLAANPHVVAESVERMLEEFDDLKSKSPTVIAFGGSAHLLAAKHLPANRYSRLVRVTHYSHYISPTAYRERVLSELAA